MEETHYEMLWDCQYCGMEKLLGVSQRFCPGCGSAQDPDSRYFPKDEDKVAVADHKYIGADKHCSACDTPNAAAAKHCINCGNSMDGESSVNLVEEKHKQEPIPSSEPKKSNALPKIILGLVVLLGIVFCIGGSCTKEAAIQVKSHSWEQKIEVQEYARVQEKAWKDKVPFKAKSVSCREKERSTEKVPDGKDCKTVKKDKGDGSFVEKEECTTRYKKVPVMDQYCTYKIEKWNAIRPLISSGKDLNPYSPKGTVETCTITRLGCQKKGEKTETYTVHFQDSTEEGSVYTCNFTQDVWKTYEVGVQYDAQVSLLGSLDCASLKKKP